MVKILAQLSPYIGIIAAFTIWGGNYIVAKITLQEFPPMSLAFLRFFCSLILLLPFLLTEKHKFKVKKIDLPIFLAAGLLTVTLNIAFFYLGITKTRAIDASALTMSIPILSVAFSWIIFKEKIYTVNLVGILSGLFGAFILLGIPLSLAGLGFNSEALVGNILILLGCLCWVIGAFFSKKLLSNYSTLNLTAGYFFIAAVAFLIPAAVDYLQNPSWVGNVTSLGLLGLLYITILSSIVAFFSFEWSLKKLGVVKADMFQYIEPPVAIVLGVLILKESTDPSFLFGLVLVLLGVYWGTVGRDRHSKAHRH